MVSGVGSMLVTAVLSATCLVSGSSLVAAPASPQTVASVPDVDPREAVGSKSAPVVMEGFSDFQCPACKSLYESPVDGQLCQHREGVPDPPRLSVADALPFQGSGTVFTCGGADWEAGGRPGRFVPEPGKVGSVRRYRRDCGEGAVAGRNDEGARAGEERFGRCIDRQGPGAGQQHLPRQPDSDNHFSRQRADISLCGRDELGHFEAVSRSAACGQVTGFEIRALPELREITVAAHNRNSP